MARPQPRELQQLQTALEHYHAGRLEQALSAARKVLRKAPGQAQANQVVAAILARRNMIEQALFHAQRAVEASVDDASMHASLGQILIAAGRYEEAVAELERAIELDPELASAHIAKGTALQQLHRFEQAIAAFERGLELDASAVEGRVNLAISQLDLARADDAVQTLRACAKQAPESAAVWTLLCNTMNYPSGVSADEVYAVHRRYGALVEKGLRERRYGFANTPEPERALRIGYVSRDMRTHSCAYFLISILRGHDRKNFQSYCYSLSRHADDMTEQIRQACTVFRDCSTMAEGELRERIQADRIDILVDLAGHSASHKLELFARRPAPVQVTYMGYPHTTGLMNMQYRFVDGHTDPEGAPAHATEELWRLPECFLCYTPPEDAPPVGELPSASGGAFTFGSFNEAKKISSEVIGLWARVLRENPGTQLLLKAGSFDDATVRRDMRRRFEAEGVEPNRMEIMARIPSRAEHLALYDRVDLGLDTYPYHGTTTTCEAMWMGVPTVSLRGDRHAARVGASLLHAVGLNELIADSHDAFVEIASGFVRERDKLAAIRRGLRERMRTSRLCDNARFTLHLEEAYRAIWQRWCKDPR